MLQNTGSTRLDDQKKKKHEGTNFQTEDRDKVLWDFPPKTSTFQPQALQTLLSLLYAVTLNSSTKPIAIDIHTITFKSQALDHNFSFMLCMLIQGLA